MAGELYDVFDLTKNAGGRNKLIDTAPKLAPELLALPETYLNRFTPEQIKEYENRFKEYKARKDKKK